MVKSISIVYVWVGKRIADEMVEVRVVQSEMEWTNGSSELNAVLTKRGLLPDNSMEHGG